MQNFYKIFLFLVVIASLLSVAACGKLAAPSPIEGSDYPHSYPRN